MEMWFNEEVAEMAFIMRRMKHEITGAAVAVVQKLQKRIRKKSKWRGTLAGELNIE